MSAADSAAREAFTPSDGDSDGDDDGCCATTTSDGRPNRSDGGDRSAEIRDDVHHRVSAIVITVIVNTLLLLSLCFQNGEISKSRYIIIYLSFRRVALISSVIATGAFEKQ